MFDEEDEHQRFIRYKNGHHAFVLTVILLVVDLLLDLQWGQTIAIEIFILLVLAAAYCMVMNVYQGAYFSKDEKPFSALIYFSIFGLIFVRDAFFGDNEIFTDGKAANGAVILAVGVCLLSAPATHFINVIVRKISRKRGV